MGVPPMSQASELALFVRKALPLGPRTVGIGFVSHIRPLDRPTVSRTTGVRLMAQPTELALFVQLPCPRSQALSNQDRPEIGFVFLRPFAGLICRNSLSAQHLSFKSPFGKLGLFGAEAHGWRPGPGVPSMTPAQIGFVWRNWSGLAGGGRSVPRSTIRNPQWKNWLCFARLDSNRLQAAGYRLPHFWLCFAELALQPAADYCLSTIAFQPLPVGTRKALNALVPAKGRLGRSGPSAACSPPLYPHPGACRLSRRKASLNPAGRHRPTFASLAMLVQ